MRSRAKPMSSGNLWASSNRSRDHWRLLSFWALPLAVVKLPRLGLADLRSWLRDRGIDICPDLRHRPLRACLVARAGQGFVFVDGADPYDEQRLSLAHEIAHYLRDYWIPRERALAALGDDIADVLDGRRQPSTEERLAGVLRGVRVGRFHPPYGARDGRRSRENIRSRGRRCR